MSKANAIFRRVKFSFGCESIEVQDARRDEFEKHTKEFAEEMMKKFTFEEVARLFYSNSCPFCPKHNECMGVDSVKECVSAIREKYDVDYREEWSDEDI